MFSATFIRGNDCKTRSWKKGPGEANLFNKGTESIGSVEKKTAASWGAKKENWGWDQQGSRLECHFHYLYLPLIRWNVSHAQKLSSDNWSQTIKNSLWLCFHVVVSSLLHCYSLQTRCKDIKISICLRPVCNHQRLVWDECKRCCHLRKLFVFYSVLSEGVCDRVTRIWKLGFESSQEVQHDFTRY